MIAFYTALHTSYSLNQLPRVYSVVQPVFWDAVCTYMYGNFSCYHSLYGFVVGTLIVLLELW